MTPITALSTSDRYCLFPDDGESQQAKSGVVGSVKAVELVNHMTINAEEGR